MKINIYQIDPERDTKRLRFLNLARTRQVLHAHEPEASVYNKVFAGTVKCRNLEDVFVLFNSSRPEGFRGRSLSVSDIVEVEDAASITPGCYFCDSVGFKEVPFHPEQAVDKAQGKTIRVVLVEPGKQTRTADIGASLEALQRTVGGSIEAYYPFAEQVCIVCNEEGKIDGLPLNRAIRDEDTGEIIDILAGTFFICGCSGESFGSLSTEQQTRYLENYRNPERFFWVGETIEAVPYKPKEQER